MIVSNLENAAKYRNIDGKIAACVEYAAQLNADTPCGRYEVSEDVYVNVMEYTPKPSSEATIETHDVYADLQLVLSGEGNTDSAITVLGLMVGAAFAHNFGLAASGEGPTANGKIAVVIGIAVVLAIACLNTYRSQRGEEA